MPPASQDEKARSGELRGRVREALVALGGDTAENRRRLVSDVVGAIGELPDVEQFGAGANGSPAHSAPVDLALSGLGRFLDHETPYLSKNLERWERGMAALDGTTTEAPPPPGGLPAAAPGEEEQSEKRQTRRRKSAGRKPRAKAKPKPKRKTTRKPARARAREAAPAGAVGAMKQLHEAIAGPPPGVTERYVADLLERVREQRVPDPALLDRIERLIGLGG